jgi:type VI secretion system protein ImpF
MPELTHNERLQPSLLDRLTDDEPQHKQESRERRVLSPAKLRECALRDLAWLFNTTRLAAAQNLDEYPEVSKSVVNFGLPELSGRTSSGVDIPKLEAMLRQAILDFEPRLIPSTVNVQLSVDDADMSYNAMSFVVEAELWSQPIPLQLYLRTEIDLENGDVSVKELRELGPSARRGGD